MIYSWYIVEFQQWNKARRIGNETKTKKMLFSINFHAELKKYEQFYHKKQETALNMDMFILTPT